MITSELICFWSSAVLLAAAFFLTLASLVFRKAGPFNAARALAALAFIAITTLGVIRWVRTGHPPFVTLFESMITAIWFTLLIYHVLSVKIRQSQGLLLPVSAACFLLLGWASNLPPEASPLSAALTNVWLFIHASFATSGAAAFVIASAYATLYLLGQGAHARFRDTLKRAPDYDALPGRMLNFLIFGLILWGIMIVSGSVWAHVAWGRYWAWDPIELWSLIGWILYALLLHARLTFKLSKRLFCWLTIVAALSVLFALWGVQYVYDTIHTYG